MKLFLSLIIFCSSLSLFAQLGDYKKDTRSKAEKIDSHKEYAIDDISKVDLLQALDIAGIRIFKAIFNPFDKKYNFSITLDEYTDGKLSKSLNLFEGDNTYRHFTKSLDSEELTWYFDFIDQITFFAKDQDSISYLRFDTYAMRSGVTLRRKQDRLFQVYLWRRYNNYDWLVGEKIPLFVYASSWEDKHGIERFCGTVDLSEDKEQTKELLDNSPHYFVISYTVSE